MIPQDDEPAVMVIQVKAPKQEDYQEERDYRCQEIAPGVQLGRVEGEHHGEEKGDDVLPPIACLSNFYDPGGYMGARMHDDRQKDRVWDHQERAAEDPEDGLR